MNTITYTKHNTLLGEYQIKKLEEERSFLDLIHDHGIEGFDAPCGGNGTCGKCRITIVSGSVSHVTENEKKRLSSRELSAGIRLACSCSPRSDVVIDLSHHDLESAVISAASSGGRQVSRIKPRITRKPLDMLPDGSLEDQRALLSKAIGNASASLSMKVPSALLSSLHSHIGTEADLVLKDGVPKRIAHRGEKLYSIAVDIGTTTVVCYLVDLEFGEVIDNFSGLNAQKKFGADVISRIAYATSSVEQQVRLQRAIVSQIDSGIRALAERHTISPEQIMQITIAGNTTMMHLLAGADTSGIAASPFIPVFTDFLTVPAVELGFTFTPNLEVELLPSVAAYVGADITAGIHVAGIHVDNTPSILLDIGTNGEMAFSISDHIICCSTAAGPAFEGANITFGTGGVRGAIDTVKLDDHTVSYTTIGGIDPIGICGSGIIDCVAELIRTGLVDYTGRLLTPEETDHPGIKYCDGDPVFCITALDEESADHAVYLTQKDIREVQLAKAAIAAGLQTLLSEAGVAEADVEHLYLAGGFGSYIRPESAGEIGLIPKQLVARTKAIGNSSGEGAVRFSCWEDHAHDILTVAQHCQYIELSGHREFQDFYIQEMLFPMED